MFNVIVWNFLIEPQNTLAILDNLELWVRILEFSRNYALKRNFVGFGLRCSVQISFIIELDRNTLVKDHKHHYFYWRETIALHLKLQFYYWKVWWNLKMLFKFDGLVVNIHLLNWGWRIGQYCHSEKFCCPSAGQQW